MIHSPDFKIKCNMLLRYCGQSPNVVIPDGITHIQDQAFQNCTHVTSVLIPESVTLISARAFFNCTNLKQLQIPQMCTISPKAFNGCTALADPAGFIILRHTIWEYTGRQAAIFIPAGVTTIAHSAFFGRQFITSLTVPPGVKDIEERAFFCCRHLQSVTFSEGLESIGPSAFTGCERLESLFLPDSLRQIGESAFASCFSLTHISLPAHIQDPETMFSHSYQLQILVAPGVHPLRLQDPRFRLAASVGYLSQPERYTDPEIADAYQAHISGCHRQLLPVLFEHDQASCLIRLADMELLSLPDFEEQYLKPAIQANAIHCVAFLLDWKNKHTPYDA